MCPLFIVRAIMYKDFPLAKLHMQVLVSYSGHCTVIMYSKSKKFSTGPNFSVFSENPPKVVALFCFADKNNGKKKSAQLQSQHCFEEFRSRWSNVKWPDTHPAELYAISILLMSIPMVMMMEWRWLNPMWTHLFALVKDLCSAGIHWPWRNWTQT